MATLLSNQVIIDKLNSTFFSDNWVSSSFTNIEDLPILINNLSKASIQIFDFYSLFLLSGEYCYYSEEAWKASVKELKAFLEIKQSNLDILEEHFSPEMFQAQQYFLTNLIKPLDEIIIPQLTYFFKDFDNQLALKQNLKTFRVSKIFKNAKYDEVITPHIVIFQKTFLITSLEHFKYALSEKVIADIILNYKEIDDLLIDNPILNALKIKYRFLLKKISYRLNTKKGEEKYLYSYDHNEEIQLNLSEIKLPEAFQKWEKIIETHYDDLIDDNQREQIIRANGIVKPEIVCNYDYFHAHIKIYKDQSKSLERIKNLILDFSNITHPRTTILDGYAKTITENYLFNNQISLKAEKQNLTNKDFQENISSYKNELDNFQKETFVYNYFPWEKLSFILVKELEKLSNDLLDKQKFELFKSLIELYNDILERFEKTFNWSFRKSLIPFQLTYEECKSEYCIISDFGNFQLFFFSSYVLPLRYNDDRKQLESFQMKKIKFETLSNTYEKLKRVVEEVNDTSDRLRNSERRSVEILAIFSAISLFTVGSIQILTNVVVGSDPMIFYRIVTSFGYCLILFVFAIWIITRNNIIKVHWIHWIIITAILTSSFFIIQKFVSYDLIELKVKKEKISKP